MSHLPLLDKGQVRWNNVVQAVFDEIVELLRVAVVQIVEEDTPNASALPPMPTLSPPTEPISHTINQKGREKKKMK